MGSSQSSSAKASHTEANKTLKTSKTNVKQLRQDPQRITGLTRLITAESKRREDVNKNKYDYNRENMQNLKQLFKKMDPTVMKVHGKSHGEVQISFKYEASKSVLLVKIINARDLAAKDLRGKSNDPYIKLWIVPDPDDVGEQTSQVVKKSLNPTYHEIFAFPMSVEQFTETKLVVQVWDKDLMDRDDFIGESIVELSSLDFTIQPVHTSWYSLHTDTDLRITGEVEISLAYRLPASLRVTIHKAWDLTNRYQDHLPNPFVKVQIPGIPFCFQTKVEEETLEPEWNETFDFPVPQDEFDFRYIVFHVVDEQSEASNESLGQIIVDLANFNIDEGFKGTLQLADLKNTERLRSKWFQHVMIQETREALMAHAAFRYPKFLFQDHDGSKMIRVMSRKARSEVKLRMIDGIPVH